MLTKLVHVAPGSEFQGITPRCFELIESTALQWDWQGDNLYLTFFNGTTKIDERFLNDLSGRVDIYIMENGKTIDTIFFGQKTSIESNKNIVTKNPA